MPPMPRKLSQRLLLALLPALAAGFLRLLAMTWRVREIQPQGKVPRNAGDQRFIYAFWHEAILPTIGTYRGERIRGLASRSFDGDLIAAALKKLGFPAPARGSSSRGGATSLLELGRYMAEGDFVVITVDGPRGPRRKAQEGALLLSQMSEKAMVPFGLASSFALRLRSWDRTIIPLPFAKVVFAFGEPMTVPKGDDRRAWLQRLQSSLETQTLVAEAALSRSTPFQEASL